MGVTKLYLVKFTAINSPGMLVHLWGINPENGLIPQ